MKARPRSQPYGRVEAERPKPAPVTVSRYLPDGSTDSFTIEDPPPRFRVDWEARSAVPVEATPRRWRR